MEEQIHERNKLFYDKNDAISFMKDKYIDLACKNNNMTIAYNFYISMYKEKLITNDVIDSGHFHQAFIDKNDKEQKKYLEEMFDTILPIINKKFDIKCGWALWLTLSEIDIY